MEIYVAPQCILPNRLVSAIENRWNSHEIDICLMSEYDDKTICDTQHFQNIVELRNL